MGAHIALVAGLWALGALTQDFGAPPQQVLTTRLVRLGPERDKALLPRLAASAPPPATRSAQALSAAPSKPRPKAPVQSAQTHNALSRLKEALAGRSEGAIEGDTDEAQLGDQYAAEIQRCLASHYVIEGSSRNQVQGRSVLVLLRIQADGRIIDHRIERSSGLLAFDQAVERAVVGCGQVSPPPPVWRKRLRQEGMQIDFQI